MYKNLLKVLSNSLIKRGKKFKVEKVCFKFLKRLKEETGKDPVNVLGLAVYRAKPVVTLKGKKVAGVTLKIPNLIREGQDVSVASKWIIEASVSKVGDQKIDQKLMQELIDILSNKGATIKKKNELHRMALSNRPFLKYM